jgi:DNA ligase-1
VALAQGEGALKQANLRLFRPLKPMLAQTTEDLAEAFERYGGRVALEYKLDGARVQIHHQGEKVHIYSRSLADVTASLPDVVAQVRSMLVAQEAILEGEAIAINERGRPLPFQHLMRRFRRKRAVADTIAEVPVQLHLFDALYVDGRTLIDAPNEVRWAALEKAVFGQEGSDAGHRGGEGREGREGRSLLVQRCLPKTVEEATAFAEQACRDGHEGVMAKDLGSAYTPGVRGKSWLKFKHVLSLDLVVVAADWGYGRRHGWLSNYHLAARDAETGEYLVVGKTFKGLTDDEFQEMTERLLELERSRQRSTVTVRPQVVVEVVFNELQASPQYQSGLALRFARIARIRDDKRAAEADTLQTLRQLYEQQFAFKGKRP